MTARRRYQPGPTDVGVLALADDADDERVRRDAVEACVAVLRDRGEKGTAPISKLRNVAFDADDGRTVETPREAWGYVRAALAALDTTDSPVPGKWRWVGPSQRIDADRLATIDPEFTADTTTKRAMDVDPSDDPLLAGMDGVASLSADARADERRKERTRCALVSAATDLTINEVARRRAKARGATLTARVDRDGAPDRNLDAALAQGTVGRDIDRDLPGDSNDRLAVLADRDPARDREGGDRR